MSRDVENPVSIQKNAETLFLLVECKLKRQKNVEKYANDIFLS